MDPGILTKEVIMEQSNTEQKAKENVHLFIHNSYLVLCFPEQTAFISFSHQKFTH